MHPKFEDASVKQTAPANALTPPTSEDMNNKAEDSGSELSDIEMDDEDTEEITPDHYYDGGRIPVFKPVRHALLVHYFCDHIFRLRLCSAKA